MIYRFVSRRPPSRGTALLLTIFLMVALLGFVAFAVDLGYITLARTQLQTAADSAALAAAGSMGQPDVDPVQQARSYASQNKVGAQSLRPDAVDVEFGIWDPVRRTLDPPQGMPNAVRVTAHANNIPLFFGRVFHVNAANLQARATATANPRDICFVVDLSGSMNNDTDPNNTAAIDAEYPEVGTQMVQNIYDDFGFGTYPGNSESVGSPLGESSINGLKSTSTSNPSPLLWWQPPDITLPGGDRYTIPDQYRISGTTTTTTKHGITTTTYTVTDSSSVITQKAYAWVMDEQMHGMSNPDVLPGIMPAAKPRSLVLNASGNLDADQYNYWKTYIDSYTSSLGYSSYLHHMLRYGRDQKPTASSSLYTPLSWRSSDCPAHWETTDGGNFRFPPREQPTHFARRAIIAALQLIKDRNQTVEPSQRDRVSIVSFDVVAGTAVLHNLDDNYDAAMRACTYDPDPPFPLKFQAAINTSSSTATETGLLAAYNLLKPVSEGGQGQDASSKVIVLLTDGKPNLKSSSNSDISTYIDGHPNSNFYDGSSYYPQDAAMMQTSIMYGKKWMFFPVELGLQGDKDFMNRMYSIAQGKTTETMTSPYGATGNPSFYEDELKEIFDKIIRNPTRRLVE